MTIKRVSSNWLLAAWFGVGCWVAAPAGAQSTNPVAKLADLYFSTSGGSGYGPDYPTCRFTAVGTNLWFTSQLGGTFGMGGVFAFDPASSNVTQLASLDNNSGKSPYASLLLVGANAWFTTASGGTGNKGCLTSIDTNTCAVTGVFSFPTNADYGWTPKSTPVLIGGDLWFFTSSGGFSPGSTSLTNQRGAIVKFSLANRTLTPMFYLDGTNHGAQPLGSGFARVDNDYYFTTFSGGTNSGTGFPNGAGTLEKLTLTSDGTPVVTKLIDLPTGATAFPGADPVPVGTNLLYFTTVGSAAAPGAFIRYEISSGQWSNVFTFVTNAGPALQFGKQPGYCTPVLYNEELYFTTAQGGVSNKGVVAKLTLANHAVTKLADLEVNGGQALGSEPKYNSGLIVADPASGHNALHLLISKGGANFRGTILSVALPAPPLVASLSRIGPENFQLAWSGGYAPFSVDRTPSLTGGGWTTNWAAGLYTNALSLSGADAQGFFRVGSANPW